MSLGVPGKSPLTQPFNWPNHVGSGREGFPFFTEKMYTICHTGGGEVVSHARCF